MTKLYAKSDYDGSMEIFEGKTECDVHKSKTKIGKKGCFHCYMASKPSKAQIALRKENTKRRNLANKQGEATFLSAYKCRKCSRFDPRLKGYEDLPFNNENRKYFKSWIRYTQNGACAGCDAVIKAAKNNQIYYPKYNTEFVPPLPILSRETLLNCGMLFNFND